MTESFNFIHALFSETLDFTQAGYTAEQHDELLGGSEAITIAGSKKLLDEIMFCAENK